MKSFFTKWLSLSIALTMVMALIVPLAPALAATRIQITSLGTEASPSRFTSNPITIEADIEGISDDAISSIYYEIENVNTGDVVTEKANKAQSVSTYEIQFENVNLVEGLNKVTLKYGSGSSVVSSAPGYAYFTPTTNILNLKFNDEDFVGNALRLYPGSSPYTNHEISGTSPNASEVEAYVEGQGGPIEGILSSSKKFSFVANSTRGSDITFTPGDNELTLVARNGSNRYQTKRSFVYDNGTAFAYNAYGIESGSTAAAKKLLNKPVIESSNIVLTTKLKNNVYSVSGSTVTYAVYYQYADVFVNNKLVDQINFFALPSNVVLDAASSQTGVYDVYNYTQTIDISDTGTTKNKTISFYFHNGTTGTGNTIPDSSKATSSYSFVYENPTEAYIAYTKRDLGSGIEVKLDDSSQSEINELPATLKVYANTNTQWISAVAGSYTLSCDPDCTTYDSTSVSGYHIFTVNVEGLPDGYTTLTLTPSKDSTGASPNLEGIMEYDLLITAAPYVILNNVYNGLIIKNPTDIYCDNPTVVCIQGRVVNLPSTEYENIEVYVNSQTYKLQDTAAGTSYIDSNGVFKLPLGDATTNPLTANKNTIRIVMKLNGQVVSEASYSVFWFSEDVPQFNSVVPVDDADDPKFIEATNSADDKYSTQQETVRFTGSISNIGTGLKVNVTVHKGDGTTETAEVSTAQNSTTQTATFTTSAYDLTVGSTVFDFEVVNSTGISVIKSITIARENVPYVIVSPATFTNNKGVTQTNINSNFVTIVIKADDATSVSFGKNAATYDKTAETFSYEATGLKKGENKLSFTVVRGTEELKGTLVVFNAYTMVVGAQYKAELASKMSVFDGEVVLSFPKDTKLMRNELLADNQYITSNRKLLFGIADNTDGKLARTESSGSGSTYLEDDTGRFKPAGKLYWIDAGTISENASDLKNALTGSGVSPYYEDDSIVNRFYQRKVEDLVVPTKRGELTLAFDSSIRNEGWKYLTVFRFDYEDLEWRNVGGVVDTNKNTIKVPFDQFGYYQVMYMDNSFDDVTSSWARDALDIMYSKGIMKNKTQSRFVPNDAISRGEFASLLVDIFDIPLVNKNTEKDDDEDTFVDVPSTSRYSNKLYDYEHIEAAARAGIIRGTMDGRFRPDDTITRQDASLMIARANELKLSSDATKTEAALIKLFTDAKSIDSYAMPAVEAVVKAGYLEGQENVLLEGQTTVTYRFDPLESMTRAQAGTIALRVMKQQKKIPK
ncbi:S-layer homology domain-containing protein [Paenibacillus sp. y28]|uniref:S-layer homology domain-containing protein n=1 Tax=Paenibacillus sp. y28 TaxID=3129110 RepID=UPI00301A5C87